MLLCRGARAGATYVRSAEPAAVPAATRRTFSLLCAPAVYTMRKGVFSHLAGVRLGSPGPSYLICAHSGVLVSHENVLVCAGMCGRCVCILLVRTCPRWWVTNSITTVTVSCASMEVGGIHVEGVLGDRVSSMHWDLSLRGKGPCSGTVLAQKRPPPQSIPLLVLWRSCPAHSRSQP